MLTADKSQFYLICIHWFKQVRQKSNNPDLLQLYPSNCGNEVAPCSIHKLVSLPFSSLPGYNFQSISSGTLWSISSRSRITAGSLFVNIYCIEIHRSAATFLRREQKIPINLSGELLSIQESNLSTLTNNC